MSANTEISKLLNFLAKNYPERIADPESQETSVDLAIRLLGELKDMTERAVQLWEMLDDMTGCDSEKFSEYFARGDRSMV